MTPDQRRFVGIMLIFLGVLAMICGGAVFAAVVKARKEAQVAYSEAQSSCVARVKALGGTVTETPGRIIWMKDGIEEGPTRVGEASVAAVMCPGWKMRSSCIGSECPDPTSIRLVLQPLNAPNE